MSLSDQIIDLGQTISGGFAGKLRSTKDQYNDILLCILRNNVHGLPRLSQSQPPIKYLPNSQTPTPLLINQLCHGENSDNDWSTA